MGLTAIMLPFRLVGALFGPQQAYEPLPQSPAPASTMAQAQAPARATRQERPVEFYNGEMRFACIFLFVSVCDVARRRRGDRKRYRRDCASGGRSAVISGFFSVSITENKRSAVLLICYIFYFPN